MMLEPGDCVALIHALLLFCTSGPDAADKALEGHRESRLIYNIIKPIIVDNDTKYEEKCRKNAENGARGGRGNKGGKKMQDEPEPADAKGNASGSGEGGTARSANDAEFSGDSGDSAPNKAPSWKTEAWNRIQAASWTKDNVKASRGAWFEVADTVGQDGVDAVVLAVKREAELAPLLQAGGREPHNLARWLRGRRWEDTCYGTDWEGELSRAKERARQAGGVPPSDEEADAKRRVAEIRQQLKLKNRSAI